MKRVLYGDIHGRVALIPMMRARHPDVDEIILLGDVGFGFNSIADSLVHEYAKTITEKPFIRFLRGNHENPAVCKQFKYPGFSFIPDGTLEDGTLFIGGAWSIDGVTGAWPNSRVVGVNWWEDEELSHSEWEDIFKSLEGREKEIHTILAHDFPIEVVGTILGPGKRVFNTRTGDYLSELHERLPNVKMHVGGHYHVHKDFTYNNRRFVVLPDDGKTHLII